jgi:hypothetical protein
MNARIAISSVLLVSAFAGSAFAETPNFANDPFASSKSRAEVQAELAAFRQSGVDPWSTQYSVQRAFTSTKTRDQVVGEYLASREEVNALNGEHSGSAYLAQLRANRDASSTLAGQNRNAH